jgi:hypothetical protein
MVRIALLFLVAFASLGLGHEGHNHGPEDNKKAPTASPPPAMSPPSAPAPPPAPVTNSNVNKAASEVEKVIKNNAVSSFPAVGIAATLPVVVSLYSV